MISVNCRSCFPMSKYVPTMHNFNSEEIFMSYSFVSPRKNLSNLRKYILGNVLTFLDSFPPSNAAKIAGCDISISDDLGPFDAFGTQLSTMHSFNSEEIFMFYSCVRHRNNLWNLTIYIFDNVQITSDSFPPSNLTDMVGCNKSLLDDIGPLDAVGTQM